MTIVINGDAPRGREVLPDMAALATSAAHWRRDATNSWTAEHIELLKKLWTNGETAAAIAAHLGGMSRSAVLGKVFRLRLHTERLRPKCRRNGRGAMLVAKSSRRRDAGEARNTRSDRGCACAGAPAQDATRIDQQNLPLAPRPARHRSFFFCGAPEADLEQGIPYCAHTCAAPIRRARAPGNRRGRR